MSNPTNPFSWQMPTAVDLVTDLPADFEVFGQAVATSMADLLGGTTGQILSKTTSADMDFTWTTPSAGKIKQVVTATYSTATTIASTTLADTGLTATITPTASNSKILVLAMINVEAYRSAPQQGVNVALLRGATTIYNAAKWSFFDGNNQGVTDLYSTSTLSYVDSPATTSATTYKIQGAATYSSSSGQVVFQSGSTTSTITLLEIGA
jgi:hypothetical protein